MSEEEAQLGIDVFESHRPTKRLGQNFLRDARVVNRIIDAICPQAHETVIEIGPGTGALTSILLERAGRLIAVEFDNKLAHGLRERFGGYPNFRLLQADALETDLCSEILPATKAKLVANLPYNISTAILQKLISQRTCLDEMVLMLQKEVVERILAKAGSRKRGYLSVLVEAYCETYKLFDVAPDSFRPRPKVWSSVVQLKFRPKPLMHVESDDLFWSIVSAGFKQKRKTILNNLRNATDLLALTLKKNGGASIVLCKAAVELQRRAETLTVEEWESIAQAME